MPYRDGRALTRDAVTSDALDTTASRAAKANPGAKDGRRSLMVYRGGVLQVRQNGHFGVRGADIYLAKRRGACGTHDVLQFRKRRRGAGYLRSLIEPCLVWLLSTVVFNR